MCTNNICPSIFYYWAAKFRKDEPQLFNDPNASQWFELSCSEIKKQTALVAVSNNTDEAMQVHGVSELDNTDRNTSTFAVYAFINDIKLVIPTGCLQSDLEVTFKAARL